YHDEAQKVAESVLLMCVKIRGPRNRLAVGDPCVRLGPGRSRNISASPTEPSTIPLRKSATCSKNDGRQLTHLCALRCSVNILTSSTSLMQISATIRIDEGHSSMEYSGRFPPEMPS